MSTSTMHPELRTQWEGESFSSAMQMPFGIVTVGAARYWVVTNGHVLVATRTEDTEPLLRTSTDRAPDVEPKIAKWLSCEVATVPASLHGLKEWAGEYVSDEEAGQRSAAELAGREFTEEWMYDAECAAIERRLQTRYAWLFEHQINQHCLALGLRYLDGPETVQVGWYLKHPIYAGTRNPKNAGRALYMFAPDWTVMVMGLADHADMPANAPRWPLPGREQIESTALRAEAWDL